MKLQSRRFAPLGDKRVDGHIKIDVDVEKLDNTGGRATYAEIKDYVKKSTDIAYRL